MANKILNFCRFEKICKYESFIGTIDDYVTVKT